MTNLSMLTCTEADATALYRLSIDDIADQLDILQHQESTSYHPIDYLSGNDFSQSFIEQHRLYRSKMCTWCHQLVDITKLSRLAVSRSMSYLDRFLATSHKRARQVLLDRREYQLAAVTAFYISAKLYERMAIDAYLLAEISDGRYSAEDILDMEICILEALQWKMNGPTSQDFVCLVLGVLSPESYDYDLDTLGSLLDVSEFQCELAAADYDLSICKPSIVALASILNSIDGMDDALLSRREQYAFLTKVCGTMIPTVNLAQVRFVQDILQQLFRQNSGANNITPLHHEARHISDGGSVSVIKSKEPKTVTCQETIKCSSPVSVVVRRPPRVDPR